MKYFASILFLSSLLASGQSSKSFELCKARAKTQSEMTACASEEASRADVRLNAVYRKILAQKTDDAQASAKIKAAERAWIAYRDAYIEAMYPAEDKQSEYGTIYPMEIDLLRAKLTEQQIVALQALLKQ